MNFIDTPGEIKLEEFFEAYFECRKHKRNKESQLEFEWHYDSNLVELWREVNTQTYSIGESICFLVTKPKLREIFAAGFRDRIIHHVIMKRLEPLIEKHFIEDTYNCRKGKGTSYGIERLYQKIREKSNNWKKDCYIVKLDISGFFMSIDKEMLLEKLLTLIDLEYKGEDYKLLRWLTKKVIMNEPQNNCILKGDQSKRDQLSKEKSLFTCEQGKGLPIGNLTSQIFANYYMSEFDEKMTEKFGYYGRYVDDFYVIVNTIEEAKEVVKFSKNFLKEKLNLTIHNKKIYIQPYWNGVKFIGSVIKKSRIYIGNRVVSNTLEALPDCLNDTEKLCTTLNSYLGFMRTARSIKIRQRILNDIPKEALRDAVIFGQEKILPKAILEQRDINKCIIKYKTRRRFYYALRRKRKSMDCRRRNDVSM